MRRSRVLIETTLVVYGLGVLLFAAHHEVGADDQARYSDIEQLLHQGHLTADRYSLVGPLFSAPFLVLGELIGSPEWWASHFNFFVVAIGLAVAFVLTRGRVEPELQRTFALVLLSASFITEEMGTYGPEILTATFVACGTLAVATGRHARFGWAAIVLGVVNTPAAIGGLALVAVTQALRAKRLRPLLAVVAAALLVMGEAWLRRGSPFTTGYEGDRGSQTVMPYSAHPGFSYPFILGVASILLSFGRGLLFFAPGLVLWLGSRTRRLVPGRKVVILQLVFLAGLVLVYAKWWAWYGGVVWGPRFFTIAAVPASLFLAARLHARSDTTGGHAISLGVLALSAWVGFAATLGDLGRSSFCVANNYRLEALCWYAPEYSGPWWPILHHPPLTVGLVALAGFFALTFAYLAAPPARAIAAGIPPQFARWSRGWRF